MIKKLLKFCIEFTYNCSELLFECWNNNSTTNITLNSTKSLFINPSHLLLCDPSTSPIAVLLRLSTPHSMTYFFMTSDPVLHSILANHLTFTRHPVPKPRILNRYPTPTNLNNSGAMCIGVPTILPLIIGSGLQNPKSVILPLLFSSSCQSSLCAFNDLDVVSRQQCRGRIF